MNRVKTIANHTVIPPSADAEVIAGPSKCESTHNNAWGYKDTTFQFGEDGVFSLSGNRYLYSGKRFPAFYDFIQKFGVSRDDKTPPHHSIPAPTAAKRNPKFEQLMEGRIRTSFADEERLMASHGHTVQEMYTLRFGQFARIVDAVVYPTSHVDVEAIVRAANDSGVALLPYGGGTTVSHSLLCDAAETRMIVAVNVSGMNRIVGIDTENLTVHAEAGCVGAHLEHALNAQGFTLGHEPDSWEFSTVGGWIATRASGMKRSVYGNIEDLLLDVKFVTPSGTLSRNSAGIPRLSCGPDVLQIVMGSEGTLGIVTEAVLKIRPLPGCKKYGSVVFPNFACGLKFMREVARLRKQPCSIRLMDNLQFQLGSSLKPEQSVWKSFLDQVVKFYVLNIKRFVAEDICAVTMTFEGSDPKGVASQESELYALAKTFSGIPAGAENGIRGYFLTFVIAYLRDFALQHRFLAESFETSVPWSRVAEVVAQTKQQILNDCKRAGVQSEPLISARVTQTYDSGACIYFYFGMSWKGLTDPLKTYSEIEDRARECVMKHGGSISHHHGVGKIRKHFLPQQVGEVGVLMLRGIKGAVDPNNVFSSGNLI